MSARFLRPKAAECEVHMAKRTKSFRALSVALPVVVLICGTPAAISVAQVPIRELMTRYSKIQTVHVVSKASVARELEDGRKVSGVLSFEYWADRQGRYRVRCFSDPVLGLLHDHDIAYDGSDWQLLNIAESMLVFQRGDTAQMPAACPNPLFLPLEFLNPDSDSCPGCSLKLTDLRAGSRQDLVFSKTLSSAPAGSVRLEGGVVGGKPRTYDVTFTRVDGALVPTSIKQLDSEGRVQLEIDAHETRVFPAVGPIPIQITAHGSDAVDGATTTMVGSWKIDELEINRPIDPSIFTLNQEFVRSIWDNDVKVFLKHPDDRVIGRPLSSHP
jgi:hypothetical protein